MSSEPSPKKKRRPIRLGKYQVLEHIATGGMGAVYKAKDVELGREVALKILPPDLAGKHGMLERFRREARSAARLRHENIVTLYEFGEEQGTHFIALEFVEGADLHEYIDKKGKLDVEVACEITRQAALALDHASKQGLVHRDIKPSNFLLTRKGRKLLVKMTDFGLARDHGLEDAEESRITRAGTTVGTVDYIAPEQAKDSGSADIRSDIYSLGCTLYHMLGGQPPFAKGSMNERLLKHIGEEPEDVGRLNPQVPEALRAVLRRMMAKKPVDRYQTPAELLRDLARIDPHARPVENRLEALAGLAEMEAQPRKRRKPESSAEMEEPPRKRRKSRNPDDDRPPSSDNQREAPDRPPSSHGDRPSVENRLEAFADLAETEEQPRKRRKPESSAEMEEPPRKRRRPRRSADPDRPPPSDSQREAPDRPPPSDDDRPIPDRSASSSPGQAPAPYRRPRGSGVINRVGPTEDELSDKPVVFGRAVSPVALVLGVIGVCVVIAGAVLLVVLTTGHGRPPKESTPTTHPVVVVPQTARTEPERPTERVRPTERAKPPEPSGPPRLYAVAPADATRLRQQLEGPWADDAEPPADTPVYAVSREGLLAGGGGKSDLPGGLGAGGGPGARSYASLADACAAAPVGRASIIEVRDNGPLFLGPAAVNGRSLVLRAARGRRPLLVWDLGAPRPEGGGGPAFLSLTQGSLTLEGLSVAVRWRGEEPGCLFRVTSGDFLARNCVFSVAGGPPAGVSVVRLEGAGNTGPGPRCRLSHCFARGGGLVGLDLRAAGARALVDDCLLVGGAAPLLQARASATPPSTLGLARSTLVGRETLLQVSPAATGDSRPALDCTAWDCVLARSNRESGGDLVALADGATAAALHWRGVNCVYAGWANLLRGPESIPAADLAAWHGLGGPKEGDKALTKTWPAGEAHDPAEVLPGPYNSDGGPVGYAASAGLGTIGCPLASLPPARDNWLALAYDRPHAPAIDYLGTASPPPLPADDGGPFRGARLNLNQVDLGAYLEKTARSRSLAPQVVLYLQGSGERRTSPVHVKGSSLVLVFEPPFDKAAPLSLAPADAGTGQGALLEVEGGSLDIIGGDVRFPDFKTALTPAYLVAVRGGNLRLHGCRLQGPLGHPSDSYQGLIRFAGSGKADPEAARVCAVDESVLLSGRDGIEVTGTGARLGVQQSAVVCGQDAFHFQPGDTTEARLNVQAVLDHTTVAARRAVLRQDDAPSVGTPLLPALVQSSGSAFLNPFMSGDAAARAGLLLAGGDALPRGLLLWRGDGDLYDKRLYYQAAADGRPPEKLQPHTAWSKLWGPAGDSQPILDATPRGTLDLERPQLDRLALPVTAGADLTRLGILKKK